MRLERDVRNRDVHDRLLRYVFITQTPDGQATSSEILVNRTLLQEGYADYLPIGPDRRYRLDFRADHEAAVATGQGRWSTCADE